MHLYKEFSLFDDHFHIIDSRFPILGNNSFFTRIVHMLSVFAVFRGLELIWMWRIWAFQVIDQLCLNDALHALVLQSES